MDERPDDSRNLEEKLTFLEREVEEVADQVAGIWKELGRIGKIVDALSRKVREPTGGDREDAGEDV